MTVSYTLLFASSKLSLVHMAMSVFYHSLAEKLNVLSILEASAPRASQSLPAKGMFGVSVYAYIIESQTE